MFLKNIIEKRYKCKNIATLNIAAERALFSNDCNQDSISTYVLTTQSEPKFQCTTLEGLQTRVIIHRFGKVVYVNDAKDTDEQKGIFLKNSYYQSDTFYQEFASSMSWILIYHLAIWKNLNEANVYSPESLSVTQKILAKQFPEFKSHLEGNYIFFMPGGYIGGGYIGGGYIGGANNNNNNDHCDSQSATKETIVWDIINDYIESKNIVDKGETHNEYMRFLKICYKQLLYQNDDGFTVLKQYVPSIKLILK